MLGFWLIDRRFSWYSGRATRADSVLGSLAGNRLFSGLFLSIACLTFSSGAVPAKSFERIITPVLTKAGCNRGSCHGAAAGRGGFHLSLYGSDPEADYREIVFQFGGRRLHRLAPEKSLLLLKATETIEHGGGQRLIADGEAAQRIIGWIKNGAYWHQSSQSSQIADGSEYSTDTRPQNSNLKPAALREVKVIPSTVVLPSVGAAFDLNVEALFDDGTHENVTDWTVFDPDDQAALEVDKKSSRVTALRPGRHLLIARYLNRVIPVEVLVPFSSAGGSRQASGASTSRGVDENDGDPATQISTTQFSTTQIAADQIIDSHIDRRLQVLGLPASPVCDDMTFIRRCCLDLVGRLPNEQELEEYLRQSATMRRDWLIESLLESSSFNRYWTLQLAKLFRLRSLPNSETALSKYHTWISEQLESHVGYDRLVKALLTARGDVSEIGAANFLRTANGPRERAELVSEVLMGSRLRCANCHDHPLDQWTQDDYHGLAAILATIKVGQQIQDQPDGRVTHPKTGQDALPKLPAGDYLNHQTRVVSDSLDSLTEPTVSDSLADWLLDRENPYFAKAIVNRLWKSMMGRGLVEPVDDFRQTNPPTHPALLEQVTRHFIRSGYDLRATLRLIARSQAYQRSSATTPSNEADRLFYSHHYSRELEPEVLSDAISDVLDVSIAYGDLPLGTRAVDLVHPQVDSRALDILGRCSREGSCESDGESSSRGLSAKLFLLNGEFINKRLESQEGRLARLLEHGSSPEEIIKVFYQAALQRSPDSRELAYWKTHLDDLPESDYREFLGDFVWSLIASREFTHKD